MGLTSSRSPGESTTEMRDAGWSDTFLKVHMDKIKGLSVSNGGHVGLLASAKFIMMFCFNCRISHGVIPPGHASGLSTLLLPLEFPPLQERGSFLPEVGLPWWHSALEPPLGAALLPFVTLTCQAAYSADSWGQRLVSFHDCSWMNQMIHHRVN